MTIVAVDVPKSGRTKTSSLTDEDIANAVEQLLAGEKVAQDDVTYASRKNAQTGGWELRNEIAERSEDAAGHVIDKANLRSVTYQDDEDGPWKVAVFMKRVESTPSSSGSASTGGSGSGGSAPAGGDDDA